MPVVGMVDVSSVHVIIGLGVASRGGGVPTKLAL